MSLPIVMLGAGGHARVVLDMLEAHGRRLTAFADPTAEHAAFANALHFTDDTALMKAYAPDACIVVNGVGMLPGSRRDRRRLLFERFAAESYQFPELVHPSATVSSRARLERSSQVMAGAVVQSHAHIGRNVIVNTRASVDHDSIIGDHTHICPGAVVCGGVKVGEDAFIGAGAILLPMAVVPPRATVAAGSVIHRKANPS